MIIQENGVEMYNVLRCNRREALGCGPGLGWNKMQDWTVTLRNFQNDMAALAAQGETETLGGDIDTRLLNSITGNLKLGKALASITNIEAAALLIRAMWKGFWSDANNKNDVFEFLQQAKEGPPPTELQKMIKNPHRLNLPIHLAAFVSPIGLLTGVQLCGRDYERYSIFLMWKALGNIQPLLLRNVEKLLWDAIFSVAQGKETGHGALTTFLTLIPWHQLDDLPEHDRHWFKANREIEMKYLETLDNIDILDIPHPWPLKFTAQESEILDPTGGHLGGATPGAIGASAMSGSQTHEDMPIADLSSGGHHGGTTPGAIGASAMSGSQAHEDMPMADLSSGGHHRGAAPGAIGASTMSGSQTHEDIPMADLSSGHRGGAAPGAIRPSAMSGSQTLDITPIDDLDSGRPFAVGTSPSSRSQNDNDMQTSDYLEGISNLSDLSDENHLNEDRLDEEDAIKPTSSKGSVKPKKRKTSKSVKGIGSTPDWPIDEAEMERMQRKEDLDTFDKLWNLVTKSYEAISSGVSPLPMHSAHPRLPLHLANPEKSMFWIETHTDFIRMDDKEKQELMCKKKLIVVTELPLPGLIFNERGLCQLAGLDVSVDVQDQSISPSDGNFGTRMRIGTLRQLLESSRHPEGEGHILNALNFPLSAADTSRDGISSDLTAWVAMENTAWCNSSCSPFPTRDVRWGLAGNTGAMHHWHIDSDGFGTFVEPLTGGKLWFAARPLKNQDAFSETEVFSVENYDMEGPNEDIFAVEAIHLLPGTRLYMPPNTPHWVVTTNHAICRGGHFYLSGSIRETIVALFRAFASGGHITNTAHTASRVLLQRLVFFWHSNIVLKQNKEACLAAHVPNPGTWEGLLDLLSLCALMELLNVVDQTMYEVTTSQDDTDSPLPADPGMSAHRRLECIAARRASRQMLMHVFSQFQFLDDDEKPIDGVHDLWWKYLGRQVQCLVSLKMMSVEEGVGGVKDCTMAKFQEQIGLFYMGFPQEFRASTQQLEAANFAWPQTDVYTKRTQAV
ncbi:hypothetical protein K443DRAFT_135302 [Laccaria amethystina LaAM-08-1]|uniref:JmjC domain-containing protein n=1 Tax=Laccaria amethystina LaAM-08-1 TaxID=1095629 RepID=A0A0C9WNY5_9AGAR|nr:hypothetical protein K443DRAFT_135302 [Laccaria amethystina LaAM-08-1]